MSCLKRKRKSVDRRNNADWRSDAEWRRRNGNARRKSLSVGELNNESWRRRKSNKKLERKNID